MRVVLYPNDYSDADEIYEENELVVDNEIIYVNLRDTMVVADLTVNVNDELVIRGTDKVVGKLLKDLK